MKGNDIRKVISEHPQAVFIVGRRWNTNDAIITSTGTDSVKVQVLLPDGQISDWSRTFLNRDIQCCIANSIPEFLAVRAAQAAAQEAQRIADRALFDEQRKASDVRRAALEGNHEALTAALVAMLGCDPDLVYFSYDGYVRISLDPFVAMNLVGLEVSDAPQECPSCKGLGYHPDGQPDVDGIENGERCERCDGDGTVAVAA
jgi:hypothetical protein